MLFSVWLVLPFAAAVGLTVPPVLQGDRPHYASTHYLANCLSYKVALHDLIMIRVNAGARIASQSLDLKVLDSQNNLLRFTSDVSDEVNLIIENLNAPYVDQAERRRRDEAAYLTDDKVPIHVCFNNVYTDRSWSFQPQPRDVELYVHLRDLSSMKDPDYNLYAKYFTKMRYGVSQKDGTHETTREEFEQEIQVVENELANIVESLDTSQKLLDSLLDHEFQLRDANEALFSLYNISSIVLISAISVLGLLQLAYYKYYFRKKNIA